MGSVPFCPLNAAKWGLSPFSVSIIFPTLAPTPTLHDARTQTPRWPMARYQNILDTIGNTPVIRLNRLAPPGINVYVKVEAFNPMGSVKDRMARAVIEDAERSGALKPGQTVI